MRGGGVQGRSHLAIRYSQCLRHSPEVLPEASRGMGLQLAEQEVGKDGLQLHQDTSVAVLAIASIRSRGGGYRGALGVWQGVWQGWGRAVKMISARVS